MANKKSSAAKQPTKHAKTRSHKEEILQGEELLQEEEFMLPTRHRKSPTTKASIGLIVILALFAATTISLRAAYSNKLYPGSWGNGLYLGGLSKQAAVERLDKETSQYTASNILIEGKSKTIKVELGDIKLQYQNDQLVDQLMKTGRNGSLVGQISDQWRLLLGINNHDNSVYSYDGDTLGTKTLELSDATATSAINAHYEFLNDSVVFVPGVNGGRLSSGKLALGLASHFSNLNSDPVTDINESVEPAVTSADLNDNRTLAESYVSKPLSLTYGDKTWQITPNTTLGWLHATSSRSALVYQPDILKAYYPLLQTTGEKLEFATDQIDSYLTSISKEIDQAPVDAQLSVTDGKATVFVQSKDGQTLNISKTREAILASLGSDSSSRSVAMVITTTKPTVTQDSISSLGITDLLSEGVSYFPGSPPNRLINVRTGAARFNGVLLKPGEVFSFGKLLGPVGAEQGYVPGLIILENREVMDYGGGLCQVSSTAYRAALLAGLPILERTNHSFAISYYTAPFGVPGVDATIYFPPVDMKFRNDTDAHILIQTEMVGTTLKFRFYGTKKKEGVIRGPFFVTGDADVNKPSQTVFYRDVLVNGQVVKTDTVNTFYKSALDFPVADQ